MVFNATFNNILAISWQSFLLVEETGVSTENHWNVASHWQTWSPNVVLSTPRTCGRFPLDTPVSPSNKTDRHELAEMLLISQLKGIILEK